LTVAAKTNTELIQDLTHELRQLGERLSVHATFAELEIKRHESELAAVTRDGENTVAELQRLSVRVVALEQRCGQIERFNPERVAFVEQRLSGVEKLVEEVRTRRWQVWLAMLGAILSAVVALVVAFVKK
jgi:hypothetical protein